MFRRVTYVRNDTVFGVVFAHKSDDHPVLFAQGQRLFPGQRDRQLPAPIAGMNQVAFLVSRRISLPPDG